MLPTSHSRQPTAKADTSWEAQGVRGLFKIWAKENTLRFFFIFLSLIPKSYLRLIPRVESLHSFHYDIQYSVREWTKVDKVCGVRWQHFMKEAVLLLYEKLVEIWDLGICSLSLKTKIFNCGVLSVLSMQCNIADKVFLQLKLSNHRGFREIRL